MRKPRDFDSELKALADKAKAIKERRVRQLGELVAATGADVLDADMLAGALLGAVASKDAATKEGWRKAGAAFFQGKAHQPVPRPEQRPEGSLPLDGGAAPR
ncbi:conjugal transfer protein TraD [Sphingobium yanoikuyae]|uniref:conjugal transfer protein TraD n=1 Tax=Sphingobium yanoikuyae TaxID=13690 RepID=UPI000262BA6D|nr:conjugal transfer protein TraD [Sphingobium yanoikuyae]